MNKPYMGSLLLIGFVFLSVSFNAPKSYAGERWINGTTSPSLSKIIRDDIRNRVYLVSNNQLYIISSAEQIIKTIPITGPVYDMAINKSFTMLDIAAGGKVIRIDLNQLTVTTEYYLPKLTITSIAFDFQDNVYVWAYPISEGYAQWGWVYKLIYAGTITQLQFGKGPGLNQQFYNGLVRTDSTGTVLFVGEKGESPLSISEFNILNATTSVSKPVFIATNPFGTLGSNLEDFAISPSLPEYNSIYVAAGSPYGIQVVNATTLAFQSLLNTGAYPDGVAVNLIGDSVYGISNSQNTLYEFDTQTLALKSTYPLLATGLNGSAVAVTVDRDGNKAFVIDGNTFGGPLEAEAVDVKSAVCN